MRVFIQGQGNQGIARSHTVGWYAAQAVPPIDAEIGQKDHLWMKTNWFLEWSHDVFEGRTGGLFLFRLLA